jgi:hypothetical protein
VTGGLAVTEDMLVEASAQKLQERAAAKPSIDLFHNIFGDSDSDDESKEEVKSIAAARSARVVSEPLQLPSNCVQSHGARIIQPASLMPDESNSPITIKQGKQGVDRGTAMLLGVFGDDEAMQNEEVENKTKAATTLRKSDLEQATATSIELSCDNDQDGGGKILFRKPTFKRIKKKQHTAADFM